MPSDSGCCALVLYNKLKLNLINDSISINWIIHVEMQLYTYYLFTIQNWDPHNLTVSTDIWTQWMTEVHPHEPKQTEKSILYVYYLCAQLMFYLRTTLVWDLLPSGDLGVSLFWQFCPVNRCSLKSSCSVLMCFCFLHSTSTIKMYSAIQCYCFCGPLEHFGPKY